MLSDLDPDVPTTLRLEVHEEAAEAFPAAEVAQPHMRMHMHMHMQQDVLMYAYVLVYRCIGVRGAGYPLWLHWPRPGRPGVL